MASNSRHCNKNDLGFIVVNLLLFIIFSGLSSFLKCYSTDLQNSNVFTYLYCVYELEDYTQNTMQHYVRVSIAILSVIMSTIVNQLPAYSLRQRVPLAESSRTMPAWLS